MPRRASDQYLQRTFDAFADDFDTTLDALHYQGREHVASLVQQSVSPPARHFDMLDAGCGTGQCGVLLRGYARRLTGVDLSGQMLRHAEMRDVYDALVQEELTGHLQRHPAAYDLIVAADTLIYFGVLEELCEAIALALRPGGWFVFTVEQDVSDRSDWSLRSSGRCCHSEAYALAASWLPCVLYFKPSRGDRTNLLAS